MEVFIYMMQLGFFLPVLQCPLLTNSVHRVIDNLPVKLFHEILYAHGVTRSLLKNLIFKTIIGYYMDSNELTLTKKSGLKVQQIL